VTLRGAESLRQSARCRRTTRPWSQSRRMTPPWMSSSTVAMAGHGGEDVLIWTEERVYFPVVYDGAEWMGSAPRAPQPAGQGHVGGQ
jgi:hypothetical protein